ncbi:MAG TPA: hypothetical protein VFC30_07545 [Solirubrobacteraceae bacterium]|nr:hypothetical protein [Solirubrobacteraceae bacterium]
MAHGETEVSQQRVEARRLDQGHRGGEREPGRSPQPEGLVERSVVENLPGSLAVVEPEAMQQTARRRETIEREHAPVVVVEAPVADVHGAHQQREQTQPEPAGDDLPAHPA